MKNDSRGFTLIEMAIVLVVMGLIVGTIVPLLVTQSKTARLKEARDILRTARDEIIGYAYHNDRCLPADLDAIGHSKDPWGNELFYRPANETICGTTTDICSSGLKNTSLNMTIPDQPNPDKTISNVAFVLASSGPNYNLQIDNATNSVKAYRYGEKINGKEFDDLYDYVSLGQLCPSPSSGGGGGGGGGVDISFNDNIAGFDHVIQSQDGVITVDENSKTITMGGTDELTSGCIWYGQDTGPCSDGVCDLGSGFRVFFRFKSVHEDTSKKSTDYASGFTFAVTSDTESPLATVCGGNGAHLGYAGTQPDYDYWIAEPKMGIEVDFFPSNSGDCSWNHEYCFNKEDGKNNHVAAIFWGNAYGYKTKFGFVETNLDLCSSDNCWSLNDHSGDDNRHGAGQNAEYHSFNTKKNKSGYEDRPNKTTWLEDAQEHTLRIDLDYNSTSGDAGIKAWVDVEASNNTAEVMSEDPDITAEMVISPELFREQMKKIRFGWTVGSSDEQAVELSDFTINFLDYNSTNST